MASLKWFKLKDVIFFYNCWKVAVLQLSGGCSSATFLFIWFNFVYLILVLVLVSVYDLRQMLGVEYLISSMLSTNFDIDEGLTFWLMQLKKLMCSKLNGPTSVSLPPSGNIMMVDHRENFVPYRLIFGWIWILSPYMISLVCFQVI